MRIDIDHVAKLAKLHIDEAQKEKFTRQMESMLDLVEQLPELGGELAELDAQNPMVKRPDGVTPGFSRVDLLQNALSAQAGCRVVPKDVEEDRVGDRTRREETVCAEQGRT